MRRIRVVAGLIADPQDPSRFLVQQRLAHASRANLWEFPGGKIEPGESEHQALIRECREELDVGLAVGRKLWSTVHAYPDLTIELELFAAEITEGQPKPLGAQALQFATIREMNQLPFCEADLPLLASLATGDVPTR
jgi:8-oxo-dGTP diphosphatase